MSSAPKAQPKVRQAERSGNFSLREGLVDEAILKDAIRASEAYPGREKDAKGRPGGLVDFPAKLRPIIVGDLHANLDNLELILGHGGNLEQIAAGKAALIIVGDCVHDDRTGYMKDMKGSVAMFDAVMRLVAAFPSRAYYLRGNHDSFDERLRKSGIAQGLEFRKALVEAKGPGFAELAEEWFESLPMAVIGPGFMVVHAGPVRGGCSRDVLVNIKDYPEAYMQLMWNRVNEFHGSPSPKEYGATDIEMTRELLGLHPGTHFIVGHNPLWNDGNKVGVWKDVIGIKDHHIIYSGSGSRAPYFTLDGGVLRTELALEPKAEVYYYG